MKLRGLFVFMLAASLAVQPLLANSAWGDVYIYTATNNNNGDVSQEMAQSNKLGQLDFTSNDSNLIVGTSAVGSVDYPVDPNMDEKISIKFDIADDPTFNSVTIGDAAAGATIKKTDNGLSMGSSVLSGLANGIDATDAATVGQMNAANALQDERLNAADEKNIEQDNRINAADEKNIEQDNRINASDEKNIEQDNRINAADNKNIEQDGRLSAHDTEFRTLQDVLGSGYNNPNFNALTAQSLTMGGHTITATNDGFDMGGARLSGIADGGVYRGSTDAVTGNQLWNAYQRMDDLQESINVVGAHAAALSGLHPIDYNPYEPTTLSAAIGTYRDEYAVAVGVFHYAKENVMFNLGASLCSDGDVMGRAGVSFTVGKSSDKPKTPKNMNEVQAQLAQVQQALADLKAENEALKARLDEKD